MLRPKKSSVWKYFSRKTANSVQCKICEKELIFNGKTASTSNMKSHLKTKDHMVVNMDNTFKCDESTATKNTIAYETLSVPGEMRSIYWKYYGFPSTGTGEILTRERVVCTLCQRAFNYKGNTSNLKLHLQARHKHELAELEILKAQKGRGPPAKQSKVLKLKGVINGPAIGSVIFSSSMIRKAMETPKSETGNNVQIECSEIDGSELDIDYDPLSNKTDTNESETCLGEKSVVEVTVPGSQPNCTIEGFHPFIIPEENKNLTDALTEFIIMDLQLPDIVEGSGFQHLLATFKSPCEIPTKVKLIEEVIPRVYENFRLSVYEVVSQIQANVVLTVEEWKATFGHTYLTFSINYQQEDNDSIMNIVLTTVHCPKSADETYWIMMLNEMIEEWGLRSDKMEAVVCGTNQKELLDVLAQRGLIVIPCLSHAMQEVGMKVCLEQEDVRTVLAKCRLLIYLIYSNASALASLRIQDHLRNLDNTPLLSDNTNLWESTYTMLEAVQARREAISSFLENIDSLSEMINITDQDWTLIEDVITALTPFKLTSMTLGEERCPLVSLLKPLLCQLLDGYLRSKDEDTINVQIMKSAMKSEIMDKYSSPELDEFLVMSTTLDPRLKCLPNMADESKACLEGPIKDSLIRLLELQSNDIKSMQDTTDKKKSKLLGMVMMLGEICPATPTTVSISHEDRSNLELVQYQSEDVAAIHQCPLEWWSRMASKCPNIARLAEKYTFVPAVAIPPSRFTLSLSARMTFENKRSNLTPDIINRLIFLNSNHMYNIKNTGFYI